MSCTIPEDKGKAKIIFFKINNYILSEQKPIWFIRFWLYITEDYRSDSKLPLKGQTLEIGVSSISGCIPIDVVFARIMPSSG